MWILKDYLREFQPEAHIKTGKRVLRNVRLLSDAVLNTGSNVYLGRAGQFIDGEENRVICVHGQDILLLETEDIEEVFNRILDCFDFYNMWSDSCQEQIENGCTIQDILDLSQVVFRDDIYVVDSSHILQCELEHPVSDLSGFSQKQLDNLRFSEMVRTQSSMPLQYITLARQNRRIFRATEHAYKASLNEELFPMILRNLFCQGVLWGWVLENNIFEPYSEGKRQLLEELGDILEKWLEKNAGIQNNMKDFSRIFREVFLQYSENVCYELQHHLQNLGWLPMQNKQICVIEHQNTDEGILSNLCYRLNHKKGCIVGMVEGKLILLTNLEMGNGEAYYSELAELLKKSDCRAGMSYVFQNLEQINEQKKLAETALVYGNLEAGSLNDCDAYILTYVKDLILKNSSIDLYHPVMRILEAFDRENEACLLQTLYYFLRKERNYSKTAEVMYVHRNTIQYRMEKIKELTGVDLEDEKVRIHLLISLLIHFSDDSFFQ